jgi:hypothetical protein
MSLGRWAARSPTPPSPAPIRSADSVILALRARFDPGAAHGLRAGYELRLGPVVLHARVDDGRLTVGEGPLPEADLVIETGPGLKALMAGEITPREAINQGQVHLAGDPVLLERFVKVFRI